MKISNEVRAGLFVVVSLTLLLASIFIMGRERQIFASQEEFYATFKDIKGLAPGAPVRLGGITIGRVENVRFAPKLNDSNVHVTLLINEDFLERLRTDCTITIETQGLLGDRFLNISSGNEEALIAPGSFITSVEGGDIAQMLTKAQSVVDNTVEIASRINEVVKSINTDAAPDIGATAKNLRDITNEIQNGEGLLHRLIYSKKDGDAIMSALTKTSEAIEAITTQAKDGDGLLHALIFEPGGKEFMQSLAASSKSFADLSSELTLITTEIREGEGLMHDMIYGKSPEGIDDVIAKLNQTASNLEQASQALSQGSGTLGALLIDPTLYDNLIEVTDDAKRSYLLREAIQSSLGK